MTESQWCLQNYSLNEVSPVQRKSNIKVEGRDKKSNVTYFDSFSNICSKRTKTQLMRTNRGAELMNAFKAFCGKNKISLKIEIMLSLAKLNNWFLKNIFLEKSKIICQADILSSIRILENTLWNYVSILKSSNHIKNWQGHEMFWALLAQSTGENICWKYCCLHCKSEQQLENFLHTAKQYWGLKLDKILTSFSPHSLFNWGKQRKTEKNNHSGANVQWLEPDIEIQPWFYNWFCNESNNGYFLSQCVGFIY